MNKSIIIYNMLLNYMANKIQNFDTGEKDNSNIIHLDLDPK